MRVILLSFFVSAAASAFEPRGGPPAEALTACQGLSAGTACGFTHDGHNLTGTCRTGPNGEAAACVPTGLGGRPHGPPPEAITACRGQSAGASCSVTLGDHSMTGTCRAGHDGSSTLACAPAGPPPGHHGPPPEAVSACQSLSAGASCSLTLHGRTLSGTCETGPQGSTLACRPAHPPN